MIKQDNRPKTDTSDKLASLKRLLNEETPSDHESSETSDNARGKDKIVFISVNGNNNVIATEKSQYTIRSYGKRTAFVVGAILSLLFF